MSFDAASDVHTAEPLTHSERRRARLEELSEMGMNLAQQIDAHAAAHMAAIYEPKGGDPARPFATVSRAVRLTLAMEARVDAQILALRKGKTPLGWGCAAPALRARSAGRARSADAVSEEPGALREDLVDRENEEIFLGRSAGEFIGTIRRDLRMAEPAESALANPFAPMKPISEGSTSSPTHRAERDPGAGPGELALAWVDGGVHPPEHPRE